MLEAESTPGEAAMNDRKMVTIKKYGNRRLYDTTRSRYINLEEVAAILKKGADIRVVDAKTEEDLTRTILLQLILEREKNNISGFPEELLKELIIIQDTPARRWFDLSMKYSLELLRRMKRQTGFFRKPLDMVGLGPSGFFDLLMGMGNDDLGSSEPASDEEEPTEVPEPEMPEDEQDLVSELEALHQRLAALEKSLGKK